MPTSPLFFSLLLFSRFYSNILILFIKQKKQTHQHLQQNSSESCYFLFPLKYTFDRQQNFPSDIYRGAHGKYKIISFLSLKSIFCWLHTTEKIFISKTLRLSGSIQFDVVKEMYYTDNKPPWTSISLQLRLSCLESEH